MCKAFFKKSFLLHRKVDFCQNRKFSNKNYHFCAQRNFKQNNCDACSYNKWNLKPQISPIFHFEYVNPVGISGVVGVKKHTILGTHNFVLRTYKISLLKNIQMEFLILVHCEQYVCPRLAQRYAELFGQVFLLPHFKHIVFVLYIET